MHPELIEDAKKLSSESKVISSNILHDLTHAVPLMLEEGNHIRWSHKSIQEYFAARYICTKGDQIKILLNYIQKPDFTSHLNLITLCVDIDRGAYRQSIAKWIAETLLKEFDSLYMTGFGDISNELMTTRKELLVGKVAFFTRIRLSNASLDTLPDHFTKVHEATSHVEAKMEEVLGKIDQKAHTMLLSNPGACIIQTEIARIIENLFKITDLPFIDASTPIKHAAEDLIEQQIDCLQINDDPSNPVNKPQNFLLVNQLLYEVGHWKFNIKKAKEFLMTLEEESKAQDELKDW